MPAKFKPSEKILVNRAEKKYKTIHYYLRNTSTEELEKALENSNTRPKDKQKYRNELVRRGVMNEQINQW